MPPFNKTTNRFGRKTSNLIDNKTIHAVQCESTISEWPNAWLARQSKGVSVGAKVATAFVPLAANAALLTSAAVEADEIRQYCNEMDELNELANEIGIPDHQAERQKYAVSRS